METLDEPYLEDLGEIKLHEHTNFKKTRKKILDFEKVLSAAVKAHVNKLLNELDQQLVIHRQMLWYTCTGSTVSYTETDVMVYMYWINS
jgi:hypothetical protein